MSAITTHAPIAVITQTTVVLKGGFAIAVATLTLALDLERRGVTIGVDVDGELQLAATTFPSAADVAAFRVHKRELRRLARYAPPNEEDAHA